MWKTFLCASEREGLRTHHVATRSHGTISGLIAFHRRHLHRPNFHPWKSHLAGEVSARTSVGGGSPTCTWSASVPLFRGEFHQRRFWLAQIAFWFEFGGGSLKRALFTSLMNAGGTFISLKPPLATPLVLSNLHSSLISRRQCLTRTATSLSLRGGGGM